MHLYQVYPLLFRWVNLTAVKRLVDTDTLKTENSSLSEVIFLAIH